MEKGPWLGRRSQLIRTGSWNRRSGKSIPMSYKPDPVDTSSLKLTPDILALTERLARNAHEIWARQRLSEGWSYGPERMISGKSTLVSEHYDELSESEKEYDRQTALETIKMLLALGYTIESPGRSRISAGGTVSGPYLQPTDVSAVSSQLASAPLSELFRIWRGDDSVWSSSPEGVYPYLANECCTLGDPLLAYDVASEGLKQFPSHTRLRQLLGLALARAHATAAANEVLLALYNEGHRDEETTGLLARTFKDLAFESLGEAESRLVSEEGFRTVCGILRKSCELLDRDQRSHDRAFNRRSRSGGRSWRAMFAICA